MTGMGNDGNLPGLFDTESRLRRGAANARASGNLRLAAIAEVTADNLVWPEPMVTAALEGAVEDYEQDRGRL